ncbi:amidohydrolase family protein [Myxococcota bacterium]|nr:amidohydrolase family protein [Myxococcota bacterium]
MWGHRSLTLALSALAWGCPAQPLPAPPSPSTPADRPASAPASPTTATRSALHGEIIDSHLHVDPTMLGLDTALTILDRAGVDRFVVKSAGKVGSPRYQATLAMMRVLKGRARAFANLDWRGIDAPGAVQAQVEGLRRAKADGIIGIKIFKALGLSVRDAQGALISPDDARLAPLFDACAELGLIVAWHVADPVAFFEPITPQNERYEELKMAPQWSFYGGDYPSHDALIAARDRVIARHPRTTFLLIHLANYPEKPAYVDALLDAHPNVYVDTSARVPEFGRHPAATMRAFFIKHQDRVLFGTDLISNGRGDLQLGSVSEAPPGLAEAAWFYARHWAYFETAGVDMDHPTPSQGAWKVQGVDLPREVLRKLYIDNAARLLFPPSS